MRLGVKTNIFNIFSAYNVLHTIYLAKLVFLHKSHRLIICKKNFWEEKYWNWVDEAVQIKSYNLICVFYYRHLNFKEVLSTKYLETVLNMKNDIC